MIKQLLSWRPSRRWLIIPPVLLGVGAVAAFAFSKKELPRVEIEEQALSLPVMEVTTSTIKPWAKGYGSATPSRTWTAIAEVRGRIVDVLPSLDSGKRVSQGDLLVQIDDSDYVAALQQRRADRDSMKAKLAELEAGVKADQESLKLAKDMKAVAQAEMERMIRLKQDSVVSDTEFDGARNSLLAQSQSVQALENTLTLYPSRIASAEANIAMAESRVSDAQREVTRTKIVSPFDGVLSGVRLEKGQIVGLNQQLFEIQDDRNIEIEAQFSLIQLKRVFPNIRSKLKFDQRDDLVALEKELLDNLKVEVIARSGNLMNKRPGKAIRFTESVNQQTRTLGVVIAVDNLAPAELITNSGMTDEPEPETRLPLRAGTFCEIIITGKSTSDLILVPRTSLDGDTVYLLDAENRLKAQPVTIGFSIGELVMIADGLSPNDRVITQYPVPAIDGKLIEPRMVTLDVDAYQADAMESDE